MSGSRSFPGRDSQQLRKKEAGGAPVFPKAVQSYNESIRERIYGPMQLAKRVAVIGAGPCGLASAKSAIEEGLDTVVFEQSDAIGGVWLYKDVPDPTHPHMLHASCYKSLTTNSSRDMTAFSDFPFPFKTTTNCPTHEEITRYLAAYAKSFYVEPHIRFNTKVVAIEKDGDRWLITAEDLLSKGSFIVEPFDAVMVCTGMFWDPRIPRLLGEERFKGPRFHSHYYRTPDQFVGKNVLLVGIGNSALDISIDLVKVAKQVTISCRGGSIMLPLDDTEGKAVDQHILNRKKLAPGERAKLFATIAKDLTAAFISYGMPPPPRMAEQSHYSILKKPDKYLEYLKSGRIRIEGEVVEVKEDQTVVFSRRQPPTQRSQQQQGRHTTIETRSTEPFDAIIYCTGYNMQFPFFKDQSIVPLDKETQLLLLYKRVLHPYHPTLCFITQLDTIGSLFNIAEMQARWLCKVWAGHAELAPLEERLSYVKAMREKVLKEKPRYPHFINFPAYIDDLAHMIGCFPYPEENVGVSDKLTRLVEEGPLLPITFRLNGYKKWAGALDAVARL